jgi:thiol-disulfide isomerase/thioredoxin
MGNLRNERSALAGNASGALRLAALGALLAASCSKPAGNESPPPAASPAAAAQPAAQAAAGDAHEGIAWVKVAGEADADRAFALARQSNKPLFLYWGAVWCPPCNQVKATIFNRSDFIERSKAFVPVYLDGDSAGAQKLGARYKVRGYPTMILFRPDGEEITRLPGEVDAQKYLQVLAQGVNGARPVKELMQQALAPATRGKLGADNWRLLAYYSWDTDEQQLVPKAQLAGKLAQLAQACPAEQADAAQRLLLKSLVAAADEAKGKKPANANAAAAKPADARTLERVMAILGDAQATRANADIVIAWAAALVNHLAPPKSAPREQLVALWAAALDRLTADGSLSRGDRVDALGARIEIAKLDDDKAPLSTVMQQHVKDYLARIDLETQNPYERQAVMPSAGHVLADAGLLDDSDALLKAELPKAVAPYYHMLVLADNAKKRGDKAGALDWYQKAYEQSRGPATRLQWGASYVGALVELAPQDGARIGQAVGSILGELEPKPETFYERNQRSLERIGKRLADWNKTGAHAEVMHKLRGQLDAVCRQLPAGDAARANCERAFAPAARA